MPGGLYGSRHVGDEVIHMPTGRRGFVSHSSCAGYAVIKIRHNDFDPLERIEVQDGDRDWMLDHNPHIPPIGQLRRYRKDRERERSGVALLEHYVYRAICWTLGLDPTTFSEKKHTNERFRGGSTKPLTPESRTDKSSLGGTQ